ncbi:MAG: hypothetical protein FWD38_02195 [Oscillospiraceae bacterium]|nr:hypothetical protein [Oscillospiraceae bacterium]
MTLNNQIKSKYGPYAIILSAAFVVYGLIYLFSDGFFLTSFNVYNSFSRQAAAWLSGSLSLPENVPWLELAVFDGNYYVPFPPVPSIIMLPFVLLFGINTPDNAIAVFISLCSLIYAYKLGQIILGNKWYAVFLSLFLVLGTNYLHISLWGAVWYIAQNMAFLFMLMAFYYTSTENPKHSYIALFALCASMGSRTFNIIYLPVVLYLINKRENTTFGNFIVRTLVYSIPAFIMGAFILWLNYARFGSVFEFGYNYLPEFVNDPHGMFYSGRILLNLGRMFFSFNLTEFPMFFGFAFWVASPIVISFFVYFIFYIYKIIAKKSASLSVNEQGHDYKYVVFCILILTIVHIFIFSLYRTLGGHQFGSRYTIDTLPAFYLGLVYMIRMQSPGKFMYLNIIPLLFGLILNFLGTIRYFSYYYG